MTLPANPTLDAFSEQITIDSIGALLLALQTKFEPSTVVWYRGQARASWKLEPSLARKDALTSEKALLAQFRRDAVPMLSKAQILGSLSTDWDWMFLMQHYGVPTRLLDWSESPLTALWFALADDLASTGTSNATGEVDELGDRDAALWALLPQKLNQQRGLFQSHPWDIPLCGHDAATTEYTTSNLDEGNPSRRLPPLAVIAERRFDRVVAQQGVFTVMHKDPTPLEDLDDGSHVRKLVIPAGARESLLKELTVLGVNELSLFPDLARLGDRVARRLS